MCTLEKQGNLFILTLTGDDEHRLSLSLIDSIRSALNRVTAEATAGSALITTAQGKFFSNGADLVWILIDPSHLPLIESKIRSLTSDLFNLPVPTIAAVTGHASAGGGVLALSHDYILMRKDRGFLYINEINIGVRIPAWCAALVRSKVKLPAAWRDVLLRGTKLTADMAIELGIVDSAHVGAEETVKAAVKLGEELAARKWDGKVYAHSRRVVFSDVLAALTNGTVSRLLFIKANDQFKSISLNNAPNLTGVSVALEGFAVSQKDNPIFDLDKFLGSLPKVKILRLKGKFLQEEMCTLEKQGNLFILTLTGDDEHRLNPSLIESIRSALNRITAEATAGSVLITTAQGKFFSNGYDLNWASSDPSRLSLMDFKLRSLISDLFNLPMPTIAAVTGHASAGGFILAMSHDYVLMRKERGFLYMSEIDIGLEIPPWFVAMVRNKVKSPAAWREVVMRGTKLTADVAIDQGIVDSAHVGAAETVKAAVKLGEELAARKWDGKVYAHSRRLVFSDVLAAVTNETVSRL